MDLEKVHKAYLSLKSHLSKTTYTYTRPMKMHLTESMNMYYKVASKSFKFNNVNVSVIPGAPNIARRIRFLFNFGRMTVISFCFFHALVNYIGYPACITGKSMQPELNNHLPKNPVYHHRGYLRQKLYDSLGLDLGNDWVWVSMWKARNFSFSRGDIVVFISPKDPYDYVIKRVIALEGDTVATHNQNSLRFKIPAGHCWVEGDNWNNSVDSNKYGPISKGLIFGVASHQILPLANFRKLSNGKIPEHLMPERVEPRIVERVKTRSLLQNVKVLLYFFTAPEEKTAPES
jgi:inner membrane protease subunit 2